MASRLAAFADQRRRATVFLIAVVLPSFRARADTADPGAWSLRDPVLASAPRGPASKPLLPPAPASSTPETIADPEDTTPARSSSPPRAARPGEPLEPKTLIRGRADLRWTFDPRHERSGPGTPGPYHEDVMELLGEGSAHLDHRVQPWLRLALSGRLWYRLTTRRPSDPEASYLLFNGNLHRHELQAELLDSHVDLSRRRLNIQAGLVTAVLGATDLVNPNDVLTARDLRTSRFLDPRQSRLPTLMVRAETELWGIGLQAFWLPLSVSHRLDLFGADFALLGPLSPAPLQWLGALADGSFGDLARDRVEGALGQMASPRPFADSALAFRAARRFPRWELALQYAWLHAPLPSLRVDPDLMAVLLARPSAGDRRPGPEEMRQVVELLALDRALLEGSRPRQHQVGLSVTASPGGLPVAFDVAYRSGETVSLAGGYPRSDDGRWVLSAVDSQTLAYTLGLTYLRGESVLLTLEGWHRIYLDLARQAAAERPPLLLGGPHQAGLALLGRYHFAALDLSFELLAQLDLVNRSLILIPQAQYRVGEHFGLVVGATLFEGAEGTLGGRLHQNDEVFVALQGVL